MEQIENRKKGSLKPKISLIILNVNGPNTPTESQIGLKLRQTDSDVSEKGK